MKTDRHVSASEKVDIADQWSDPRVVLSVTIAARGSRTPSEFMSRLSLGRSVPTDRPGHSEWPISTSERRSVVVGSRDDPRHRR